MNTYSIYFGSSPIATVSGTEYAYEVYSRTKALAELLNKSACLVWDETGEIVADFDPCDFEGFEVDDADLECGFDPYEGCYTFDC